MGRKSKLYFNESLNQYCSTIKGKKHYFGSDETEAQILFEKVLAGDSQEPENSGKSSTKTITLQNLVAKFLAYKQGTAKDSTVQWYSQYLKPFCQTIGGSKRCDKITLADIQTAVDKIGKQREYALNSQRGLIRAIKSLFSYAVDDANLLDRNPAKSRKLSVGSYSKAEHVSIATDEQCQKAIKYFSTKNPALADLISFLYFSGCRLAEARQIKLQDINLSKKTILIARGDTKGYKKTGRRRTIYLSDKSLEIINRNMADKGKTDYLFQYPKANSASLQWLPTTIQSCCERAADKLGFNFNLRSIRHTAITNMLLKGIDILTVAKIVGHADTKMITRIYEELSDEHLLEKINLL